MVEETAIDTEDPEAAAAGVQTHLDRLAKKGIAATGLVLHSVGDHASAGNVLAKHAADIEARSVVIGTSPHGRIQQLAEGSITSTLANKAGVPVLLIVPGEEPHELTAANLANMRNQRARD